VKKLKWGGRNVRAVKGYTEITERENTLPSSAGDNVVLMQKFPSVFCCAQYQPDILYIGLVMCAPFRNFHVHKSKIKHV